MMLSEEGILWLIVAVNCGVTLMNLLVGWRWRRERQRWVREELARFNMDMPE
jgi:hypothetical protein